MLKKKESKINYLELIPERTKEYEIMDGKIVLLVPKFKNNFLKSLIPKKKSQNIKISLDELGSEVWNLIDGNNKVLDIIEKLNELHEEKIQQAEERVTKFLTQLFHHKFVIFKNNTIQ
jgi:hypothetical protein